MTTEKYQSVPRLELSLGLSSELVNFRLATESHSSDADSFSVMSIFSKFLTIRPAWNYIRPGCSILSALEQSPYKLDQPDNAYELECFYGIFLLYLSDNFLPESSSWHTSPSTGRLSPIRVLLSRHLFGHSEQFTNSVRSDYEFQFYESLFYWIILSTLRAPLPPAGFDF